MFDGEIDLKLHIDRTEANVRKVPQILWLCVCSYRWQMC